MPDAPSESDLVWVPAEGNPWKVPVLDVRPVTQAMVSTSSNPEAAKNAVSYGGEDGTGFQGAEPPVRRSTACSIVYRRDRLLADGALFIPSRMEHKWAVYFHDGELLFVRSWQRKVFVAAQVEQEADFVKVESIHGTFSGDPDESPEVTARTLDFIVRSHALGLLFPAPLPPELAPTPLDAAMWCFSRFGNMVHCATPHPFPAELPGEPLRSISLLHMAVAQRNFEAIDRELARGIPIDLTGADGCRPIHWALMGEGTEILDFLLRRGASVGSTDLSGSSTLMMAVEGDRRQAVRWLLDHGADPNARDGRGFTALHRASEMGKELLVRDLLGAGADPSVEAQGHTALSLAKGRGHLDIIKLLGSRA